MKFLKYSLPLVFISVLSLALFIPAENHQTAQTKPINKYPQALYSFKKDGLYGYINYLGEVVIAPKFKFALNFNDENTIARVNEFNRGGNQYGFINRKGDFILKPQFPSASGFTKGLAVVGAGREAGYINTNGKLVIDYQFVTAGVFQDGIAKVSKFQDRNGYKTKVFGYIDQNGKEVIPIQYQSLGDLKDGRIIFRENENDLYKREYAYFNKDGKLAFDAKFKQADEFSGGLAYVRVKVDDIWKTGFINTQGVVVFTLPDSIEAVGAGLTRFSEGHSFVSNASRKYAVIDSLGNLTSDFLFTRPGVFSEGLAPVELDGKTGYIDYSGTWVIAPEYDGGGQFQHGIAWIFKDMKYGFINAKGILLHEPEFAAVKDFRFGLAAVLNLDGSSSYVNEDGKVVFRNAGDQEHFHISPMQ